MYINESKKSYFYSRESKLQKCIMHSSQQDLEYEDTSRVQLELGELRLEIASFGR